ncbi:hypothetical protein EWB00_005165 [Schistosoma japonicum]|uniref:Atos-like conserved domain-containing protein n=1 Tax=Schistosoma japonicum TaxID=6182 RepID=A0A4Z2D2Q9_SCHJA|nr:hypothetical protein EWB00_005165 [Schistosoma japonicum]
MATVKEPHCIRKYKLTHRSYLDDSTSRVGDSFLMDASDMLSMDCFNDTHTNNQHFSTQDDGYNSSSVSKTVGQTDCSESSIRRIFTPVHISETEILHISVVTLKHLPQHFLGCPLCLDSNKSVSIMPGRTKCFSPVTLSDSDVSTWNTSIIPHTTHVKSNLHLPNVLNLPKGYTNEEVVRSPIVVMTDTEEKFIQSTFRNPLYNVLPPCSSWNCTDSGQSTLTKKSSRAAESNRISQVPLESPPRKQQRVSCYTHELTSATKESESASESLSVVSPTIIKVPNVQREGYINKVIAEFTLLNVERDLIVNSVDNLDSCNVTSSSLSPINSCFSSSLDVHRDAIQCKHLSCSIAKKHDHASESQLNTDAENSVLLASPSANSQPVPRLNRRRNATSVSLWPSSSYHNDGIPFFNRRTGLPLQSSPVPLKRSTSGKFDFDSSLNHMKTSRSSVCMIYNHNLQNSSDINNDHVKESSSNVENLQSSIQFNNTSVNSTTVYTDISGCGKNGSSSNKSNQTMSFRRRPSSLQFISQHQEKSFNSSGIAVSTGNNRHTVAATRRRNYPVEMDSIELSCSAPPSGDRGFQMCANMTDRLSNTMACTPVPHGSSQHLLVNFEESMLNGRIHPVGQVEGFSLELGASGSFYPNHIRLPMKAYFFNLSDDNAPSPYLGYADLKQLPSNKGYHIPKKGSIQLTLFNPTGLVVKMFVIVYDLADMPPNCQTFLRQRTVYMPIQQNQFPVCEPPQSTTWPNQFHLSQMSNHKNSSSTQSSQLPSCHHHSRQYNSSSHQITQKAITHYTNSTNNTPATTSTCPTPDHIWNVPPKSVTEPSTPSFLSFSSSSCSCSSVSSVCSTNSYGSQNAIYTNGALNSRNELPAYLRYLVHLRFHTTRSGKLYLHTDLRLIFSRDKFEFDPRVATYELRSFIDAPSNPRYSPKKWSTRHHHHHHSLKHPRKTTLNTRVP